ncbi:hypothetical protein BQ8420_25795 [Nocardiopsis sp. JB363]|nr:hypothetical protein BQ8420_25795 [Nocardiopsis sp. JB363]
MNCSAFPRGLAGLRSGVRSGAGSGSCRSLSTLAEVSHVGVKPA